MTGFYRGVNSWHNTEKVWSQRWCVTWTKLSILRNIFFFSANFTVLMILLYRYLLNASPYSSLISHFVNWLFQRFSSYLSAICYVHKLRGLHDPTKSFLIHKLLTALSRRQPVDIRFPVTRPVLHELARALSFTNSSAFQRSLFSALFLVAFYGLFRTGELTAKSKDLRLLSFSSVLNLTFLSRNGRTQVAKTAISEYNHNTSRRPFDILIARAVSSAFCPVLPLFNIANCGDLLPGGYCHI